MPEPPSTDVPLGTQVVPDPPVRRIRPMHTARSCDHDVAVIFTRRHLWTPPVSPLNSCGFAPRTVRRTLRFFVAKASPDRDRSPRAFALGHPPHLSAGGARFATGSDAPCRLFGADRSFHLRPARFDALRRARRRDDRPDQGRSLGGVLPPPRSRSRTPSTSSIHTFRCEVGPRSSTLCQCSRTPGTPFRLPLPPACHGDGPLVEVARPRAVTTEAMSTRCREDASPRSLQPTCCQQAPCSSNSSRAPSSHPAVHGFGLAPPPARLHGLRNESVHPGVD